MWVAIMSYRALSWAAKQHLPAYEKLVLLMLANRADDHDKCWPSVAKIMDDCGVSRAQAQKCRKKLEERGLVRRDAQTRTYGQTSNMYYLNLSMTIEKQLDPPPLLEAPPPLLEAHKQSPLINHLNTIHPCQRKKLVNSRL